MRGWLSAISAVLAIAPSGGRGGEVALPRLEASIPLPGVAGRIDHLALDLKKQRLFVAALGHNTVEVVDLAAGKVVQSIRGLAEPQGVLFIPDPGLLAVAGGGDGILRFFDGDSWKPRQSIEKVPDADNLRLDPKAGRIVLGHGAGALSIVDARKLTVVGEVKLAGHPESFQLESKGSRIYVNVPSAYQVAVVDREMRTVESIWKIEGAEANFPMALDEDARRLFIGCRKPPRLVVLDTGTGKQVASEVTSGDADDLFLDPTSGRIYISCGEGFLDVFRRAAAERCLLEARIVTAPGARTSLLSPESKRLFLAVPRREGREAEIRVYRTAG
jgi:hypothetical protein